MNYLLCIVSLFCITTMHGMQNIAFTEDVLSALQQQKSLCYLPIDKICDNLEDVPSNISQELICLEQLIKAKNLPYAINHIRAKEIERYIKSITSFLSTQKNLKISGIAKIIQTLQEQKIPVVIISKELIPSVLTRLFLQAHNLDPSFTAAMLNKKQSYSFFSPEQDLVTLEESRNNNGKRMLEAINCNCRSYYKVQYKNGILKTNAKDIPYSHIVSLFYEKYFDGNHPSIPFLDLADHLIEQ